MDKLARRIDMVSKHRDALRTTRANVLERPPRKIEALRQESTER